MKSGLQPKELVLTDEVLFGRFQKGVKEAFDEILARYKAPLFSLILKSVKNRGEAEEVFQEVFIKVIEKRDLFSPTVSFKAWIYTVCRNTCIDVARKHKRRPADLSIFVDEEKPLDFLPATSDPAPDELIRGAQLDNFLDEALKVLPPEQRETFYLKIKGELTFEEIGGVMKCSANTAKSRMRYALETLRKVFRKREYLK